LWAQGSGEELDVAASAVNVLFVLHNILDDEFLALVGELLDRRGDRIEASILAGLDTLIFLSIVEVFAGRPVELATIRLGL